MESKPRRRSPPKPRPYPKSDRGPGIRLTFADRYRLLELHRANPGMPYRELAGLAGTSEETARLTCLAASKNAADLMGAYAEPMLRRWIEATKHASRRGDHRPSRDWLLHAGSIEPLPDTAKGNGPAVVIINAPLPGMPGVPLARSAVPVLTVTPSTTVGENPASQAPDPDPDRKGSH